MRTQVADRDGKGGMPRTIWHELAVHLYHVMARRFHQLSGLSRELVANTHAERARQSKAGVREQEMDLCSLPVGEMRISNILRFPKHIEMARLQ